MSDQSPMPMPEPQTWDERVFPGRFAGETVIVTGAGSGSGVPPRCGSPRRAVAWSPPT